MNVEMKKILEILIISLVLICSCKAEAYFIVDTGMGSGVNFWGNNGDGKSALKFTLPYNVTLNTAEFFMFARVPSDETRLDVGISLYSDNANSPGEVIASKNTFITEKEDWYGVTFNEELFAGDYWIGSYMTEPLVNQRYQSFRGNAPNPQEYGAFTEKGKPWKVYRYYANDYGLRIDVSENTNVIPEPATLLLFGTGLLGAFVRRKRKA